MSEILLSPFIFVISKLYALSLLISGGNPGLAIIFLSIFIFFLTTPINSLVSKLIKRENEKKIKLNI